MGTLALIRKKTHLQEQILEAEEVVKMSLDNFSNDFDADTARYERMNRVNPSEFPPGQGSDNFDDIFSSNTSESVSGSNQFEDIFSSSPNTSGVGGTDTFGNNNIGGIQNTQQQVKPTEDKVFDAVCEGGKKAFSFGKVFISSFKGVTPLFWQRYGYKSLLVSIIVAVAGLLLWILGVSLGSSICIGGVIAAIPSVIIFLFNTDNAKKFDTEYTDEEPAPVQQPDSEFGGSDDFFSQVTSDDDFDSDFDGFDSESDDDFEEEDYDDDFDFGSSVTAEPEDGMDIDKALETSQEFDKGMYTRSYLYDMFTKVLPKITPSFYTMREYDPDDDAFLQWGDYLREAAEVTGCKEDYLPELETLEENLFTIKLSCDRPTGFKPDAVANELASIYAHLDENSENVSAKAEPVGGRCYITIFTGKTAMISLKDMYDQVEDFMLNSSNYIPIVLGVNTKGEVIKYDFKKLESIIITGMPRSGKSWLVQCVLYQMCSFVSPRELHITICDPKEGISDFKSFVLPHVKNFVCEDNAIIDTLRKLVKVEAPRRKKIIGDAGFVNIWDYKEVYPEVYLPVIYVVVDEVVTLASRMDKETNNEFRMLLRELISQLPALGIRAFLIPHVLNNDIIEKKTSDLVPCKISVCGDADHVEKATGSKPKDFPHKLKNKGDMAVRMPSISSETMFIHAPALTDSNTKNAKLFDYARRVWSKLEPDEVANSVSASAELEQENKEVLEKLESTDDDFSDMFSM